MSLESRAIQEFGLPVQAPQMLCAAYLAYLGEALTTTCTPDVWPPLSYREWRMR